MAKADGIPKKIDENKLEWGELRPAWITSLADSDCAETIRPIVDFFVVETPCKGVSTRGIALSEYGWLKDNPPKGGYHERRLFESAGFKVDQTFFTGLKREDMKEVFSRSGMSKSFAYEIVGNRAAMLVSGNTVICLLRTIRNSLAHCRFEVMNKDSCVYFVLENGVASVDRFDVRSRIALKAKTLLQWIEIIKTEADKEIEEEQARKRAELELMSIRTQAVLDRISKGLVKKEDDLIDVVEMKKNDVRKAISHLKDRNFIEYSRKERVWRTL